MVSVEWRTERSSSFRKNRTSDKRVAYPVVEFTSADGHAEDVPGLQRFQSAVVRDGGRVEVLHRADSRQDARINAFVSVWLGPMVFAELGLLAAGIGTAVALVTRRRDRVV